MKKQLCSITLIASLLLSGCTASQEAQTTSDAATTVSATISDDNTSDADTQQESLVTDELVSELSGVKSWSTISLKNYASSSSDNTVKISDDNKVTIKEAGYYSISGELAEGVLSVKTTDDNARVVIKLCGVTVKNSEKTAFKIKNAGSVTILLEDGTENTFISGTECEIKENTTEKEDDEDGATGGAINSVCNLTICGNGTLNAYGYLKMGLHSKKDILITSGSINVISATEGIKANENLTVNNGSINITAGNDAFKTKSSDKSSAGNITINSGNIAISAFGDAFQSENNITINGGEITAYALDALDAGNDVIINDGTFLALCSKNKSGFTGSSSVCSFVVETSINKGDKLTVSSPDSTILSDITSPSSYRRIIYFSPKLNIGNEYLLTIGNNSIAILQSSDFISII